MSVDPSNPKLDSLEESLLRAGSSKGSDQAFEDAVRKAYQKIEDDLRRRNPNITPEQLDTQIDQKIKDLIKREEAEGLHKEVAIAFRKALDESKNAQEFARLLTDQRDKLAPHVAGAGGMDAMQERMMGMLLGFMEKLLGAFGLGGKMGLSSQFAGVSGQPQKPVPQPGDPNFMGPMPEMVGPPAPAVAAPAAPAVAAPAVAETRPIRPDGPIVTTDLPPVAPAAAASGAGKPPVIDSAAITAANDIDYATVTDGSRPPASFQASIQPSAAQQLLATPVAQGPFTSIVPPAVEPFSFDIGQSNQLRNDRFAAAAQPPAFTIVDPRAPAVDVGVVAQVGTKVDAANDARALGFGT